MRTSFLRTAKCPNSRWHHLHTGQQVGQKFLLHRRRIAAAAATALYTVIAMSQTANMTPLSCSSLIPMGNGPSPGATKSPGLGFQKALRTEGAFVPRH